MLECAHPGTIWEQFRNNSGTTGTIQEQFREIVPPPLFAVKQDGVCTSRNNFGAPGQVQGAEISRTCLRKFLRQVHEIRPWEPPLYTH